MSLIESENNYVMIYSLTFIVAGQRFTSSNLDGGAGRGCNPGEGLCPRVSLCWYGHPVLTGKLQACDGVMGALEKENQANLRIKRLFKLYTAAC